MNLSDKKTILSVLVFVLVAVAAGFYVWRDFNAKEAEPLNSETEEQMTTRGVVRPEITETPKLQIPDLDRPTAFSAGISEEARKRLVLSISEVSDRLKKNYDYLQDWLQLGILRKQAGDYEGAVEAWDFAGLLRPQNATSFLNLADLYGYYIHDNKKAEESFLKAVLAEPQNGFPYFQVAKFYNGVLGENQKAKDILQRGISAGADPSGDLQSLINSL